MLLTNTITVRCRAAMRAVDANNKLVTVHGVDLYPPPTNGWSPPNCHLEVRTSIAAHNIHSADKLQVDDVLKEWTWPNK